MRPLLWGGLAQNGSQRDWIGDFIRPVRADGQKRFQAFSGQLTRDGLTRSGLCTIIFGTIATMLLLGHFLSARPPGTPLSRDHSRELRRGASDSLPDAEFGRISL